MENVLLPSEMEFYVETMSPQPFGIIGTKHWLEWHQRIQKLNQQALIEAADLKEEHVKETLVSYEKVPVLIHEAISINIWKQKILPLLLKLEPDPHNTFMAYSVLYHEAVCVALLELVLFHENCCETLKDYAADLLDYATGTASQLLVITYKEDRQQENTKEELSRQTGNLSFEIGIRSLTIIRYISEYLDRLPLDVASRMYSSYDVPVLFVELLLQKPWIRGNKQFYGGKWLNWDGEALSKTEAQIWISLHQLLLNEACCTYYSITESRRNQLVKLFMFLTPVLLDQLSILVNLKMWLSQISVLDQPMKSKPLLMETFLEVKERILNEVGGKWKKTAKQQLEVIFCKDQKVLMENAQMLSEAFNTDLLEKMEQKENMNCENCGQCAIQRCSQCKKSWYCSRSCQVAHWPQHNCIQNV